jgi:hypothetical protein
LRQPGVIGVEQADILTLCHLQGGVARGGDSAIGLSDDAYGGLITGDNCGGLVSRPVVDDD